MPSVPKPKRRRQKHFFKEWREYCELSQDRAVERMGWSKSKLSRIENGLTPYNEDDLYAAAEAYSTTPESILTINPLKDGDVVDLVRILRGADPEQRTLIADLAKRITGKN